MARTPRIPKCRAYHEAGHVVAAIVLKLGVRSVSVIPDKTRAVGSRYSGGRTEIAPNMWLNLPMPMFHKMRPKLPKVAIRDWKIAVLLEAERHALFLLAGIHAETRRARRRPRSGFADYGDRKQVAEVLCKSIEKIGEKRTKNDLLTWLARLCREARALIKAHWRSVEKVAARLLVKHVLTSDEVAELIPAE
jgi:hypothetical protein